MKGPIRLMTTDNLIFMLPEGYKMDIKYIMDSEVMPDTMFYAFKKRVTKRWWIFKWKSWERVTSWYQDNPYEAIDEVYKYLNDES